MVLLLFTGIFIRNHIFSLVLIILNFYENLNISYIHYLCFVEMYLGFSNFLKDYKSLIFMFLVVDLLCFFTVD